MKEFENSTTKRNMVGIDCTIYFEKKTHAAALQKPKKKIGQ